MKRLDSYNKLLKPQEQHGNRYNVESYRQEARLTGFGTNDTVYSDNTGVRVENWKKKYNSKVLKPAEIEEKAEKLQNIINDVNEHKRIYKDERAHAFERIAAFISGSFQKSGVAEPGGHWSQRKVLFSGQGRGLKEQVL